ncbi:hypothetical protein, partial [Dialister hominis]|uniref:hypothetical protein n=1 Tax=Dialister hominis TaxID=2582419 RepID=UPI003FEDDC4C
FHINHLLLQKILKMICLTLRTMPYFPSSNLIRTQENIKVKLVIFILHDIIFIEIFAPINHWFRS